MRLFAPREWSATIGLDGLALLFGVYVFWLVIALMIGSVPLSHAPVVGVVIWSTGAVMVAAGWAYCLSRFHREAVRLLLPARRVVLLRAIAAWAAAVVALPAIGFWVLVPGSRSWMTLMTAAPIAAALSVSLCVRASWGRRRRDGGSTVRAASSTTSQVIAMFFGRPFTRFPAGLRARAAMALGIALWSIPPTLYLILPTRAWKFLIVAYLVLTFVVIWAWFMAALARFAGHRSGNYAELALLPGLGDATRRRRALYRAALSRPLLLAFCGLSGFILFAGWHHHSLASIDLMALCCIELLLFWCAGIFQLLLTAKEKVSTLVRVSNTTLIPLVVSNTFVQTLSGRSPSWLYRSWAHWFFLLFLAVLTIAPWTLIWIYTSGLARQPHPFLASAD